MERELTTLLLNRRITRIEAKLKKIKNVIAFDEVIDIYLKKDKINELYDKFFYKGNARTLNEMKKQLKMKETLVIAFYLNSELKKDPQAYLLKEILDDLLSIRANFSHINDNIQIEVYRRYSELIGRVAGQGTFLVTYTYYDDTTQMEVEKGFTLHKNTNVLDLLKALLNNYSDLFTSGSDNIIEFFSHVVKEIHIIRPDWFNTKILEGAFFHKLNTTNFNLSRYQIYTEEDYKSEDKTLRKKISEHCFIHTLELLGIKLPMKADIRFKINMKSIKDLCEKFNISLVVHYYDKNDRIRTLTYGDSKIAKHIALYQDHYFVMETIILTGSEYKHKPYTMNVNNYTSLNLIRDLDNKGLFKFNQIVESNWQFRDVDDIDLDSEVKTEKIEFKGMLTYKYQYKKRYGFDIPDEQIEKSRKNIDYNLDAQLDQMDESAAYENNTIICSFDFEADTSQTPHEPYMVCCIINWYRKTFINDYNLDGTIKKSCAQKFNDFLFELSEEKNKKIKYVFYAHNLKYDLSLLLKYIKPYSIIKKNGQIYNMKLFKNVELRDSYKVLPYKLEELPNLIRYDGWETCQKEIFPYNYYTIENISKEIGVTKEAAKHIINQKDREKFISENESTFNMIEYAEFYCIRDCEVLLSALKKTFEYIEESTGINLFSKLTISSIAFDHLIERGCFDGCFKLGGSAKAFIEKCINGGTVAIHNNKVLKVSNEKGTDLDANSLYPSAMYEISLLKGKPKKIPENKTKEWLDNKDGYFVHIKITKVGKEWGISNIFSTEKGIKVFHNNPCEMYVSHIALNDLIKYQEIEYEIIRGYYFDEGVNNKIKEVISNLYDTRLKLKKTAPGLANIYKLIMNSAYGKSIMKSEEYTYNCVDSLKYSGNLISYTKYNKFYLTKTKKSFRDNYTLPQFGVMVLDQSKSIMNRVKNLIYEAGDIVEYGDTDSLQIKESTVEKIKDQFKEINGYELLGDRLGQFKVDFEISGCHNISSLRRIYLQKKTYIHELEAFDIKTNDRLIKYHVRTKGLSKSAFNRYCEKNKLTPFEVFEKLYNKEAITFEFIDKESGLFKFAYQNGYVVSLESFKRTIQVK